MSTETGMPSPHPQTGRSSWPLRNILIRVPDFWEATFSPAGSNSNRAAPATRATWGAEGPAAECAGRLDNSRRNDEKECPAYFFLRR